MQNSGTFGGLSDGVKKTMVGAPKLKVSVTVPKAAPRRDIRPPGDKKDVAPAHRRGGFAKHAKGGK